MKTMDVLFHLVYGRLISFKGLQRDILKCRGLLVEVR